MPEQLTETRSTVRLTEATGSISPATDGGNGRYRVLCINEGQGSSGFYPRATLQEAAKNKLIAPGTFVYLDHPGATESMDRPERSVRDLAAVFTSEAAWSDEHNGLVADLQVFGPHRPAIAEMAPHIGLSIRGSGETEMREGKRTVTSLDHIESVDFVTKAGRGGKVLSLLESARASHRAVKRGVAEATVNERRDELQQALTSAYGGEERWAWIRDFDDDHVWFELTAPGSDGLYQQAYSASDSGVELTGDRFEVRAQTTYVPVPLAGGSTTTTETTEEGLVPELTEAEVAQLRESATRAEAARDAALAEAAALKSQMAESAARVAVRAVVAAKVAESQILAARTQGRLVESIVAALPVVDGAIADTAVAEAVTAAVTAAEAEAAEYTRPAPAAEAWGSFAPAAQTEVAEAASLDALDADLARIFNRTLKG